MDQHLNEHKLSTIEKILDILEHLPEAEQEFILEFSEFLLYKHVKNIDSSEKERVLVDSKSSDISSELRDLLNKRIEALNNGERISSEESKRLIKERFGWK